MKATVSLPLTMFTNTVANSDYYGGGYQQGPFVDYTKVLDYYNAHTAQFSLRRGQSGPGYNTANYDLIEKVSAAYVMNTLDLTNRIRLVAGVCFVQTNFTTPLPSLESHNTFQGLALSSGAYLKVLPSALLRFWL